MGGKAATQPFKDVLPTLKDKIYKEKSNNTRDPSLEMPRKG
jgi:hypothetical protein